MQVFARRENVSFRLPCLGKGNEHANFKSGVARLSGTLQINAFSAKQLVVRPIFSMACVLWDFFHPELILLIFHFGATSLRKVPRELVSGPFASCLRKSPGGIQQRAFSRTQRVAVGELTLATPGPAFRRTPSPRFLWPWLP